MTIIRALQLLLQQYYYHYCFFCFHCYYYYDIMITVFRNILLIFLLLLHAFDPSMETSVVWAINTNTIRKYCVKLNVRRLVYHFMTS